MNFTPVIRPALVALTATVCYWLHVSDSLLSLSLNILVSLVVWWVMSRLVDADTGWFCALLFAAHAVHAGTAAEMGTALVTLLTIGFYDRAIRGRLQLLPLLLAVAGALCCAWLNKSVLMLPLLLTLTRVFQIFWHLRADQRPAAFRRGLTFDLGFWTIALLAFLQRSRSGRMPWPSLPPVSQVVLIGLAAAVAVVVVVACVIGKHAAIFSACFFAITLLPASTSLYLPALGICLMAAFLINQLRDIRLAYAGALALTFLTAFSGTAVASVR